MLRHASQIAWKDIFGVVNLPVPLIFRRGFTLILVTMFTRKKRIFKDIWPDIDSIVVTKWGTLA